MELLQPVCYACWVLNITVLLRISAKNPYSRSHQRLIIVKVWGSRDPGTWAAWKCRSRQAMRLAMAGSHMCCGLSVRMLSQPSKRPFSKLVST